MPKVSVLICVYNDERNIGRAIDSILSQSFQDFEIVVVNDGSTDGTGKVLKTYREKDPRISVIDQPNGGTTQAANNGLQHCRGKYVARLDSDDFSYPHRLQMEVSVLDNDETIGLVGGGCDIVDNKGRIVGSRNIHTADPLKTLWHRCIFQQSDVMFRKDLVLKLGGYRGKFRNAQDYDLWLRISEQAKIVKLNSKLGAWTLNAGGYTLSRKTEQIKEVELIKKMARRRRNGEEDGYAQYMPGTAPAHRSDISPESYRSLVAALLLKDFRKIEARRTIAANTFTVKTSVFYAMTFLPTFVLNPLFKARELYLNRRK